MRYRVKRHAVTQPSDQSYKIIPLTCGKNALVDATDYDWLMQWNWSAQNINGKWYAIRRIDKYHTICMHRAILGLRHGIDVDHIDNDGLNNRRHNLRRATRAQNNQNKKRRPDNASGYIGIGWIERLHKWRAVISANNKYIHLGCFSSAEEAAHARDEAAKKLHKDFASLNF